ncbi:MAG TPA: winged helix DNA-binding domain-containing protein [Microlunatus sp.]|nr:winged helix DNA-binding domain-containing protein [Microlunatus sp.]
MQLTERQLNRTLLRRQLLVERTPVGVVEAVRRLVGLQAQQAAAPYLALWNRIDGFAPAELDAAFAEHRIVKASLLRITLHAVAVEDREVFHAAMTQTLRAARLHDRRFTRTGLTSADADASVADLLTFLDEPRTNSEVDAFFAERLPELPETGIWWALRTYAPLIHAPGPHPWTYGHRPAYLAAPSPASRSAPVGAGAAMVELARRYLAAYGPATPADLAQFSTLYRPPVKQAFADLTDELVEHTGPDGKPVYDLAGQLIADEDTSVPPRLLGMWDNALLAHTDRGRLIPAEHRATVIRRNGDVLPMLLVDGYVAGVWRPVEEGIEATAFRRLPPAVWETLAAEAADLKTMLADREPLVFGRYGHWWKTIDGAQVKVL